MIVLDEVHRLAPAKPSIVPGLGEEAAVIAEPAGAYFEHPLKTERLDFHAHA